jgi:hypothetical protein
MTKSSKSRRVIIVKRPNSFRPIVAGLESRSLLSGLTTVSHPAIEVHVLRTKVIKHLPPTTTTLTSSTSRTSYATPVTFTATVRGSKRNAGNPTGTVTFKDGSTVLGSVPVSIKKRIGTATFRTSSLGPGNHVILATYSGNTRLATSSNAPPVALQVSRVSSTLTLTSSTSSVVFGGGPVSITATVAPSVPTLGPPTGTVTFSEDGNVFAAVPVAGGVAESPLITSPLSVGIHAIVATYSGDGNFNSSDNGSSPLTLQVGRAPTKVNLMGPPSTDFIAGQSVTYTAQVVPLGTPTTVLPTGVVMFTTDLLGSQTSTLQPVNGVAQAVYTFTAPAVSGNFSIIVKYLGDVNFM